MSKIKCLKHVFTVLSLLGGISLFIASTSTTSQAKTTSVVAFNSEYGLILIDSISSRAAFDLFETLNVPVQYQFFAQTKIFAPKDKSFRIACTAYSANYICAVIVYPSKYATLNFDTDEIKLKLPSTMAKSYAGAFNQAPEKFHFATEDKRLIIDWSQKGLSILNFRYKDQNFRKKMKKLDVPGIEL